MAAADVYCNTTTDLLREVPEIGSYGARVRVQGFGLASGIVYHAYDCGPISSLSRDGVDLGAAQASAAAVNTDGEWHWDSAADVLTIASTADPEMAHTITSGPDEQDELERAVEWASELVRSMANRPILPLASGKSSTGANWPPIITRITAKLACAELVRARNPELAAKLEGACLAPQGERPGWLDLIRSGQIALPSDPTAGAQAGVVTALTRDASTTGQIVQLRGTAAVDSDVLLVEIQTGGTLTPGTASPVTYRVLGKDDTGLQRTVLLDDQPVTGGYDPLGYGLSGRFSPGKYAEGDSWEIEVAGDAATAGSDSYQVRT